MTRVHVSNADMIWFPRDGITKGEIVSYYKEIAFMMLPHIKNRPITMHRFPDGIDGEGFYHKDTPSYFPQWIKRVTVRKKGGVVHHVVCNNQSTLMYLANQGCITPHIWLSKISHLNYPDRMIFDLDPPKDNFSLACKAAFSLRKILREYGLTAFVMTTGSRGLHIAVPIKPVCTFDSVRLFAKKVAERLVQPYSHEMTVEVRKEKRRERLYVDTLRNAYAQTGVCPYAVRARDGAPIATPISWYELSKKSLTSDAYTIKTIFKRVSKKADPWKMMHRYARTLRGF